MSTASKASALRTLLESHKQVLGNMRALCDGQLALVKTHELARRVNGEGVRGTYLQQMGLLAMQQKLLAMQLSDALGAELAAGSE